MKTLTIQIENAEQETELYLLLDKMHVQYKTDNVPDDTSYLMSSPAMATHLQKAIEQHERNEGVKLSLDDVWK